jgi:hypothetical protein
MPGDSSNPPSIILQMPLECRLPVKTGRSYQDRTASAGLYAALKANRSCVPSSSAPIRHGVPRHISGEDRGETADRRHFAPSGKVP